MSPEARTSKILDHAANIVSADGVAALSVEKICTAAGVSKSLVYNYFRSTTDVLQALLKREMQSLRIKQTRAAEEADTFEQLVRGITREYLLYIEEHGQLIYRLQSEPCATDEGGTAQHNRDASVRYLAGITSNMFDIPLSAAIPVVDISFGLPDAAGRYLDEKKANRQTIEDITVAMIIGGVTAIKDGFNVKFKSLR